MPKADHCAPRDCLVYGLVDPRCKRVRYVGKTVATPTGALWRHLADARKAKRMTKKVSWIRSLTSEGLEPLAVVIDFGLWSKDELNARETRWIAHYRGLHADALTNGTRGGDGGPTRNGMKGKSGLPPGYWETPEGRASSARTGATLRERFKDPEFRERYEPSWTSQGPKISAALKGRAKSEEHREKLSIASKARHERDPDHLKNALASRWERYHARKLEE